MAGNDIFTHYAIYVRDRGKTNERAQSRKWPKTTSDRDLQWEMSDCPPKYLHGVVRLGG